MSSPKDYVLDITPSVQDNNVLDLNLIKFTVRNRRQDPVTRFKVPLLAILIAVLAAFTGRVLLRDRLVSFSINSIWAVSYTHLDVYKRQVEIYDILTIRPF